MHKTGPTSQLIMQKPAKLLSKFGKKELDHFFAIAKCAKKNQAFTFLTAPSHCPFGRILIVASRKYGNAPERNKLRRRLKAIYLEHELYKHLVDLAVIARPTGKKYDYAQLTALLLDIFKQR